MTRRYGARKLADLQEMLNRLETSLLAMPLPGGEGEAGDGESE
jgi:hypothetical protein